MIHSVSSSSPVSQCETQQNQHASHPKQTKESEHQDTVELSEKARATAGNRDHDGD